MRQTPLAAPVRILHLEDNRNDHLLVKELLAAEGIACVIKQVVSRAEYEVALNESGYDVILSDFTVPSYDGAVALAQARRIQPGVPFIFFSGTIGEEVAVESLRNGATDYVLKQRPQRLVSAVRRAVEEARERREHQQAEEKIREQAALLDKAQDAIVVCDLEDRVLYWNQSAERIYGWKSTETTGRHISDLLFTGIPSMYAEVSKSVTSRGEWVGELQLIGHDNRPLLVQSSWTLVRDEHGRPKSKLIISTNITGQKQLEEQFLRAQRLESLGVLAGGIAHDLNNALAPVFMGIGFLRLHPLPAECKEILNTMDTSAHRGAEMVRQVLTFARGGEGRKATIRVDHLLKEMGKIIRDTFPKSISCRLNIDKNSWPVAGFATQLHQVIMNLCINARDAMRTGGTLTLATENVHMDEAQAAKHAGAKPGRYLCLAVTDTGTGIPPEELSKIFQPFFTTKSPGEGTGLGLSTSFSIITNHGGFITVESARGSGSQFRVYLPALGVAADTEVVKAPPILPPGNGECILIVDDEEAILVLTRTTLENYGYRVFSAGSGPEAVACLADNPDDIELVITDTSMPFMDGQATIAALRKIKPELKIIAASGSAREKRGDTDLQQKTKAFIQKPFTVEALLNTIHQVLTAPA